MTDPSEARARWQLGALAAAKKAARARPTPGHYAGGSDVADLYGPDDLARLGFEFERDVGFPGEPPFTRGIHPTMYRGRHWTMRAHAGAGSAEQANRRLRALIDEGRTAFTIAFDLPTELGRDSDHPLARATVGKAGVALDALDDMRALLADVPLERVSLALEASATAAIVLGLTVAVADERGVPRGELRGTIRNDVLEGYVASGSYIYRPRESLRLARDVLAFVAAEMPRWHGISIGGHHLREAGCDAAQEIAFTLGNGGAYVQDATRAGMSAEQLGRRLSFALAAHDHLIEEVAKFRAARRVWCRLMESRFGVGDARAKALRLHVHTAASALQGRHPHDDVVRTVIHALAAVLGGTQSLRVGSPDEAFGPPTAEAVALAHRTQEILAHESGLADFVDPMGGSYAIEALTTDLEQRAWAYLERIEQMGGMVAAIEQGYPQREIQAAAYRYQLDVDEQRRLVVGRNHLAVGEADVPASSVDRGLEARQVERLRALRDRRDADRVTQTLDRVAHAARGTENLVPPIVDAVKAEATLGEISDVLRSVFGEHQETLTI